MTENKYLTTEEALSLLKIGRSSLYRIINEGRLKQHRLGARLVRYDRNEVLALIGGADHE